MYKNTPDEQINDTRNFLMDTIGVFIEIIIENNRVDSAFFTNETLIDNNSLYDNVRCYTKHSVPTFGRDCEILKLFEHICSKHKVSNKRLFFALGDFPIIMKNRMKHPHYDRCLGDFDDIYPKYLENIYSRSIIPNMHDDLLLPTRDYINVVLNLDHFKLSNDIINSMENFKNKISVAVFRGTFTGNDRIINNTRIRAKMLSLEYPSYLDVNITNPFNYYMYDQQYGPICTLIDDDMIIATDGYKSMTNQLKEYKYILHIDGFVSAWRLVNELFSMSVILKVNSEWIEHYYNDLVPYYHYIPIKSDLSDLIQTIEWCKQNDEACYQIAKNAYDYAINNVTVEKTCNYLIKTCKLIDNYDETISEINDYHKKIINIALPILQTKEVVHDFSNIKYKHYMLPVKECHISKNIFKINKIVDRTILIDDNTFDNLITNTQMITENFRKKNDGHVIYSIILDGNNELYKIIETQISHSLIKIFEEQNKYIKIKQINIYASYCNLDMLSHFFNKHGDISCIFFTNDNNIIINGKKTIVSKTTALLMNHNTKINEIKADNSDLKIIIHIGVEKCFYKTVRAILKSIEQNIIYIDYHNWDNNNASMYFLQYLIENRYSHLCANVKLDIKYNGDSHEKTNMIDLASDFFAKVQSCYDLISDICIDGQQMHAENTDLQYVTVLGAKNVKLNVEILSSDLINKTFECTFKLYLFQSDIRKKILI